MMRWPTTHDLGGTPLVVPDADFQGGTVQPMTDVSRGARSRRGGRGPGWILLTALLVLAILASSTLVFTNRVELLRLAVILSLWAAVLAAFVTVIYRRQSELDKARARDMKFVYDLQLDREISARREYELSVESHLRRRLSREIRAEAADEMAGLRTELAALRSQLEVMLGADLGHRPALEGERLAATLPPAPGRVESSRVTVVAQEVRTVVTPPIVDNPIIDVHEAPLVESPPTLIADSSGAAEPDYRGSHRRGAAAASTAAPAVDAASASRIAPPPRVNGSRRDPEVPAGRHASNGARSPEPDPARGRHWVPDDGHPAPIGRHRGPDESADDPSASDGQGQHSDGQSFAEMMARFQGTRPTGGGGRRRRED